jgi:hypothetical protein
MRACECAHIVRLFCRHALVRRLACRRCRVGVPVAPVVADLVQVGPVSFCCTPTTPPVCVSPPMRCCPCCVLMTEPTEPASGIRIEQALDAEFIARMGAAGGPFESCPIFPSLSHAGVTALTLPLPVPVFSVACASPSVDAPPTGAQGAAPEDPAADGADILAAVRFVLLCVLSPTLPAAAHAHTPLQCCVGAPAPVLATLSPPRFLWRRW